MGADALNMSMAALTASLLAGAIFDLAAAVGCCEAGGGAAAAFVSTEEND
jgi:hypothetical protein